MKAIVLKFELIAHVFIMDGDKILGEVKTKPQFIYRGNELDLKKITSGIEDHVSKRFSKDRPTVSKAVRK